MGNEALSTVAAIVLVKILGARRRMSDRVPTASPLHFKR